MVFSLHFIILDGVGRSKRELLQIFISDEDFRMKDKRIV
jgi:hypothetical protein